MVQACKIKIKTKLKLIFYLNNRSPYAIILQAFYFKLIFLHYFYNKTTIVKSESKMHKEYYSVALLNVEGLKRWHRLKK